MMNLDLPPEWREMLTPLLRQFLPGFRIWAFGSRVNGKARRYSDLDLAVLGDAAIDWLVLAQLREALSESDLPIMVDIVDLKSVSAEFRLHIESVAVPFPLD